MVKLFILVSGETDVPASRNYLLLFLRFGARKRRKT